MTEENREKLKTKHEVFDKLTNLTFGSSVLMLDESHFESLIFFNALLDDAHIFAVQVPEVKFKTHKLNLQELPLNDLSILMGKFRHSIKKGILIHQYLPNLLVKEDEGRILAMLEDWMSKTRETSLFEIYTLPRGTFPNFERKLQSLCDGTITIKIEKKDDTYQSAFTLTGICKPEYHLVEHPYIFEDGKLLIKWGGSFTDQVPKGGKVEIEERKNFLKENLYSLQVVVGKTPARLNNQYDYMLYSQIIGKRLSEIQLLFPEIFEELSEKIAKWDIADHINLEKVDVQEPKPVKKSVSFLTQLALGVPTWISVRLFKGSSKHKVPVNVYLALREASEAISASSSSGSAPSMKINKTELENFYQEMVARVAAVKDIKGLSEDPRSKLDLKYVPKIISLTLAAGYLLSSEVKRKNGDVFKVRVKDCFMCKELGAKTPICNALAATMTGVCKVVFKEKFSCDETECKAMGDKECVFILKRI